MEIHILDNSASKKISDALIYGIKKYPVFQAATAFIKQTGLSHIKDTLETRLEENLIVDLIVGLDFRITEPDALDQLFEYKEKYKRFNLYCYRSLPGISYHPKMYVFSDLDNLFSIIGSSNLTGGGLFRNKEVNVSIFCETHEDLSSEISSAFIHLKLDGSRIIPNKEYLDLYRKSYRRSRQFTAEHKKMHEEFNEIEKKLPHATFQRHDLNGWLKNVFDVLPDAPFKSRDIYQYETLFKE